MNTHMKRRHSGHMGGGMNNNRRHQNNKFGGGGNYQNQRPRKNYAALREKFMNQARDAMSSGDRVLAEYYLQHADHYYRMQQEFLAERAARFQQQPQNGQPQPEENPEEATGPEEEEVNLSTDSNVLPSFITRQVPMQQSGENKAPNVNWEEE